jgi:hypothetical protein
MDSRINMESVTSFVGYNVKDPVRDNLKGSVRDNIIDSLRTENISNYDLVMFSIVKNINIFVLQSVLMQIFLYILIIDTKD